MIKHAIETHTFANPAKVLAQNYGAHIYNIQLTADCDNGAIVKRGNWLSLDLYEETAASTMKGVIRQKATNGNWYVEITENPDHELFVYQVPMIAEEYSNAFKKISNFYNAAGDVVRAYDLVVGDIVELSELGFEGTPVAGKAVTVANKKFVVAA